MQATWTRDRRRIQARAINHMDPSPSDHPSMHVLKIRSKWISWRAYLVTRRHIMIARSPSSVASSDGRDLSRFQNRGAPHGHIMIIRSSSDEQHWIHCERTIVEFIIRGLHRTVDRERHQRIFLGRWIDIDEQRQSTRDRGSIMVGSWPIQQKMGSHNRSK